MKTFAQRGFNTQRTEMRIICIILCACLLKSSACAQTLNASSFPEQVLAVENRISSAKFEEKARKNLITGTDGAGELILSKSNDSIIRINVSIILSNRRVTWTYVYFENACVLFVKRNFYYKFDPTRQNLNPGDLVSDGETRYYFKGNALLSTIILVSGKENGAVQPNVSDERIKQNAALFLKISQSDGNDIDIEEFIHNP